MKEKRKQLLFFSWGNMASISYLKNDIIAGAAQNNEEIYVIANGSVAMSMPGIKLTLTKGDVIGACEFGFEARFINYMATEDTTVLSYSVNDLSLLLAKQGDFSTFLFKSCIKQILGMLEQYRINLEDASKIYDYTLDVYAKYCDFCVDFGMTAHTLEGLEVIREYSPDTEINNNLAGYYKELQKLVKDGKNVSGEFMDCFVKKISKDARGISLGAKKVFAYLAELGRLLLDEPGTDMFGMLTEVYFLCSNREELKEKVGETIIGIEEFLNYKTFINPNRYIERTGSFDRRRERELAANSSNGEELEIQNALSDSVERILSYSELDDEDCSKIRTYLDEYKRLDDYNSTDDAVRYLRNGLTAAFYKLYEAVALNCLREFSDSDEVPDKVIMMFLEFAYIDPELCTPQDLTFLYKKAGSGYSSPNTGIYTFYEWLKAIYTGKKMPLKSELDVDYENFVHEKKVKNQITASQEQEELEDPVAKVKYEIRNMFQSANKVTNGRISLFCPVFVSMIIYKKLGDIMLGAGAVRDSIDSIRNVDYRIFYREVLYRDDSVGIQSEFLNKEILPDVILMPNAGSRGLMWQEIQGRSRTTPSVMMLPVFDQEDIKVQLLRMCGEYRWEMCKRVQGARWNDVTDASLTSEYFDYAQFYKKNHSLSQEAKDRIKTAMSRAKNSYKELFIFDYIIWVLYESEASPRLNKVVRGILAKYCPFKSGTRKMLASNPNFSEYMDRFEIKNNQRIHRIDLIIQKLTYAGVEVPAAIKNEREFLVK